MLRLLYKLSEYIISTDNVRDLVICANSKLNFETQIKDFTTRAHQPLSSAASSGKS